LTPLRIAIVLALTAVVYAVGALAGVALFLFVLALYTARVPNSALDGVVLERKAPSRLFLGEAGQIEVVARNDGRLPVTWMAITDLVPFDLSTTPLRWATSLASGETRRVSYSIVGRKRGSFRLGPSTAVSGDLFGWQPAQRSFPPGPTVIVYPRIVPLHQLGLPAVAPFPELRNPLPLHEDPLRIVGVRPYQTSDSARRIHWTASAHHGSLLVTRLQFGFSRETMVLLDLSREGMGSRSRPIELAVTAAASILYHIVTRERLAAGLRLGEIHLDPATDDTHLMAMLEVLAVASANDLTPTALLQSVGLPYGATLILITRRLGSALQERLHVLRTRGWRPVVVVVDGEATGDLPGVKVWPVNDDHSLTEVGA
jgi:uncharacterized protein (DUF58 family)